MSHSGEEAEEEEEEEEEKEEKEEKRRRKVDTKHNFTTLFSPTWTAASSAQILPFTLQINMKNFSFLNVPKSQLMSSVAALSGVCALKATES